MADEFGLPDIGEGLAEGEIVKWLVAVGDTVVEDQPLVEVMTDKATVEIPSPRAGKIAELRAAEGEVVEIGTTILVFGDGDSAPPAAAAVAEEAAAAASAPAQPAPAAPAEDGATSSSVTAGQIEQAREVAKAQRQAVESTIPADLVPKPWEAPIAGGVVAPAARRLAGELGVDVGTIPGTGPGGLVTKEDVRAFAAGDAPAQRPRVELVPPEPVVEEPVQPAAAPEPAIEIVEPLRTAAAPPDQARDVATPAIEAPAAAGAPTPGAADEERVPLRGLRRTIAARMVEATTRVPHYTYVEEVDMTEVVALREEAKPLAAERGVKLTYLPFIIRALVLALKEHPYLNAMLDDDAGEIVLKRYYHIGIATNTDRGLMVPVIRGADRRDLFDLAAEIMRLSSAARDGSIGLEDLQNGTFTITSTGNIGGFLATPVINVPEVAILGITSIRERPVVHEGKIAIRHMLNLSLSCDHRVVDGAVAALFVRDLVKLLADPKLQLLAEL